MAQSVAYLRLGEELKNLVPGRYRLIVKPEMLEAKSGIFIPKHIKERNQATTGIIEAIGPGAIDKMFYFRVGDRVAFSRYAGVEMIVDRTDEKNTAGIDDDDGREHRRILDFDDILCGLNIKDAEKRFPEADVGPFAVPVDENVPEVNAAGGEERRQDGQTGQARHHVA